MVLESHPIEETNKIDSERLKEDETRFMPRSTSESTLVTENIIEPEREETDKEEVLGGKKPVYLYCRYCGKQIDYKVVMFCKHCGKPID